MKKLLMSIVAIAALAGCTYYDYYKGDVRYTQDGNDCIYYADEYARNYSDSIRGIDGEDRIVYKNTKCADLFLRDNAGRTPRSTRMIVTPATTHTASNCTKCGGCNSEMVPVTRRFYTLTDK
ncbi:MAG: hypothetical protein J6T57_01000 [Alphaproteobacteria bacterium]|nr:hypothetical protein [Alphaproteobacteria bacterium]